jgi:hypothetical protein
MFISFCNPRFLWLFVLLGTKVSAKVPPSLKGQLQGELASVNQNSDKNLASNLLKSVLKDQLNIIPEVSKNYVFLGFEPGMLVENICNGGSQYVES